VKINQIANYEVADITIQELYNLNDISAYQNKILKGTAYLITGDRVHQYEETKVNSFGQEVKIGKYIYH
jgi:hypothetical protein